MGVETLPKVSELMSKVENDTAQVIVSDNGEGYFAKIVDGSKEYFFVAEEANNIEDNQDDFVVKFSKNHQVHFIVPAKGNGGFRKF